MESKDQHELYERARKRIKQKKYLYYHFVLFLIGSVLFIVLNTVLNVGEQQFGDWFKYAVLFWFFIWILHFVNVIIIKRYFGEDWERIETEKLIAKHHKKSENLENVLIKKKIISPSDKLPESQKKN